MSPLSRFTLASLVALSACQPAGSGALDAAPTPEDATASVPDAGPKPDADPSCRSWRRVRLPIAAATLEETRPVRVDRAARIRLEVEQCPGDAPGLWGYGWTLENEFLAVDATAWRAGPDCDNPEPAVRHITVTFPYASHWTLITEGDPLVVDVKPAAAGACGSAPESACERDCDCPSGERCLSGSTADGPIQRCARPCELDRECGGGVCGDAGGLSLVCSNEADECGPDKACPDGFVCQDGTCAPTFVLNAGTRHSCSCDSDCDPGLRCAALQNGDESPKSCQVTCPTASGGWCQGAHTCNAAATVEPDQGVCGWVGE